MRGLRMNECDTCRYIRETAEKGMPITDEVKYCECDKGNCNNGHDWFNIPLSDVVDCRRCGEVLKI